MTGKTQRGCTEEIGRLRALGVKISVRSSFGKSRLSGYYVRQIGPDGEDSADQTYVRNKVEALKILRMYDFYKRSLLDQTKGKHSGVLRGVESAGSFGFSARVRRVRIRRR